MSSNEGPPWYVWDANGEVDILAIPPRLLSHPVLLQRGIVPTDPLKPGVVYATAQDHEIPQYVVKILKPESEERAIYRRLLGSTDPKNHTVPCEITSSEAGHPLLIMPRLWDHIILASPGSSLYDVFGVFLQVIEGIEYLHNLRIAHLDLSATNVLATGRQGIQYHPGLTEMRLYIIDFDISRQLSLGPGAQPAITLPRTQVPPPNGMKHFDPYSWDVYCSTYILHDILGTSYHGRTPPWIARWYIKWLTGNERGCKGVCRCRPTARKARLTLVAIRCAVFVVETGKGIITDMICCLSAVLVSG